MFYVLLGGYRREILGLDEWEYEQGLNSGAASYNLLTPRTASSSSGSMYRGQMNQWLGSTLPRGGGMTSAGYDDDEPQNYFGLNNRQRLHQSVPQLRVTPDSSGSGSRGTGYGMARSVSTTLSESIRAAASQEAKGWNLNTSSPSKGPAALKHLRGSQNDPSRSTVEQRQELFDARFRNSRASGFDQGNEDELSNAFRRHNLHKRDDSEDVGGPSKGGDELREQKRLAIERMIRECRGTGLDFVCRENE